MRGITVGPIESSLQPEHGYGTESSAVLLDELAKMGTNWISITPFGRIWSLESTDIAWDFEAPYPDNRAAIIRMVRQAHERGIQVLLIPHLWVETGGWRGEIDPGSEEGWLAYQASYQSWLLGWAQVAAEAGADAFSIGVECKSWSGRFGAYWTRLISEVRQTFGGYLTYSANWDEIEGVLFWDQLDVVGINAFYPLADADDASVEEYLERAEHIAATVAAEAETLMMPITFVEVGYTTRRNAAVQPWLWPDGMEGVEVSEWEQARALAASFEAFLPYEWFTGFFIWRYYANLDDVSQEAIWGFSPHAKMAESLLVDVFQSEWGVDPRRPW
jgi:hypothetical protein